MRLEFKDIDNARKILGLEEEASLEEIKNAYRRLATQYHPDRCKNERKKDCEKRFKEINHAKDILLCYCTRYRCSFSKKDVKKHTMDTATYKHLKQFYNGWWGDLDF